MSKPTSPPLSAGRAKSQSEVVELQTNFVRRRVEMSVEQTEEFQALTIKAATDVTKPVEDAFHESLENVKVA